MAFLPVSESDMNGRGWEELDFLYVSGDAYVDHPSFGHAIITRILESEGFKVGIIPQPNLSDRKELLKLGRPKLGVLISSGVIDSMVNHYTASKKPRSNDLYSPGGRKGLRPDRAVIVYANKVREVFKDIPIIIGGIEASLRRFAHYDYWDNKVRRSVLVDSKADILVYGMGERPIVEIAKALKNGSNINEITNIRGTCYLAKKGDIQDVIEKSKLSFKGAETIYSYEECASSKQKYAKAFRVQYEEQDAISGNCLIQPHGDRYLVQNPPTMPLSMKEMDRIYSLPYERNYHPMYETEGGIPAIEEVKFSLVSQRGCFGGCSFCALNFHQGRVIQARSHESIIQEAKKLIWLDGFKGYIHDVGGPTANFRLKACKKQEKSGVCKNRQCLSPVPCKNLIVSHDDYVSLLKKLREIPDVKKVFIRSGIRYDYLMLDKSDQFFKTLCEHHVSGQLKVAPEHVCEGVLKLMGKPKKEVYTKFVDKFFKINERIGKEQYIVPYLVSSHPGSDLNAAIELAEYLRDIKYTPEQVQDFYPTPGTLSTCMFYTGIDPITMKEVYVPLSPKEKAMQRALLQYRKPENYRLVYEALMKVGRRDLIGFGPKCLIRPKRDFTRREDEGEKTSQKVSSNNRKIKGVKKKDSSKRDVGQKKKRGKR